MRRNVSGMPGCACKSYFANQRPCGVRMIHAHSLGRAARYYAERTAFSVNGNPTTFREVNDRVAKVAAALTERGFRFGDRVAALLPNEPEYIELIYACAWLGLIIVPINTRLSAPEIDHILGDASPRGLIRHSSLPAPQTNLTFEFVIDQDPLDIVDVLPPEPIYDPEAVFTLIYTSGTTGRPKGVTLTHANILANMDH